MALPSLILSEIFEMKWRVCEWNTPNRRSVILQDHAIHLGHFINQSRQGRPIVARYGLRVAHRALRSKCRVSQEKIASSLPQASAQRNVLGATIDKIGREKDQK